MPVTHNSQTKSLSALVVKGAGPSLLGRDWLQKLKLDWKNVFFSEMSKRSLKLDEVLKKHEAVFKKELGTMKDVKSKIYVDPNAVPIFIKARPPPYALKQGIEAELERLISGGNLYAVQHSEWAAPIVPILTPDKSIRDFKLTVNSISKLDSYPIHKGRNFQN